MSRRYGTTPRLGIAGAAQLFGGTQGLVTVEQNLFQQTYACTAPLLSNTGMYPTVRGALLQRACAALPRPTSPG